MGILSLFKRKKNKPENILEHVHKHRGVLWENIRLFKEGLISHEDSVVHHTPEMDEVMPVNHHLKDGLYTREIFMPKGMLVVSLKVMTDIGTQRVAYIHEDTTWVCVYRTDATTIEEAEKEVYTENYKELPEHVILNKKLLCQEQ